MSPGECGLPDPRWKSSGTSSAPPLYRFVMFRVLILAVVISACTSPPGGVTPTPTQTLTATSANLEDSAAFRTECATSVLSSFIDAFNRADVSALATFFSATQGVQPYQWFVTPDTPPYGPDLAHLGESFASWHAAGERWRLVSLKSGVGPSWHGGVDFELMIERSWSDRSVVDHGKGAVDCRARKIFVLGIGGARP